MAANFWTSSQSKFWTIDRDILRESRGRDGVKLASPLELHQVHHFYKSNMRKIAKKLQLRQQIMATALVYYSRYYVKIPLCEVGPDPMLVGVACLYLAAKVEESPMLIQTFVAEAQNVLKGDATGFPYDAQRIADFEFYLLETLQFQLVVHHPYRSLKMYAILDGRALKCSFLTEIGLHETFLMQSAWFVVNDCFMTDLPLMFPPHILALGAISLAISLNTSSPDVTQQWRQSLSQVDLDPTMLATVVETMLQLYRNWERLEIGSVEVKGILERLKS